MKFEHKLDAPELTESQFQCLSCSGKSVGHDVFSYETATGVTVNVFRFCDEFVLHAVNQDESDRDHKLHTQSTSLERLNAHLAGFCDYHDKREAIKQNRSMRDD